MTVARGSTYVLVHGAWHGGWCWRMVAGALRDAGHEVHTPTLTGLGDRSHLLSSSVNLDTHVRDVVAMLDFEDLHDVILVGHSYAGMLVTGAAVDAADRIRTVVSLDGFVPLAGEAGLELLPPVAASHYTDSVIDVEGVRCIPPRPLDRLGVTDAVAAEWLLPRLVPQPYATYAQPAHRGAAELTVPGVYLQCVGWASPFDHMAARARDLGWRFDGVDGDHEIMATRPDVLVRALLDLSVR